MFFPHLSKQVNERWGLLNTDLVFPALNAGDELKVVVTLAGDGRQIPFYVRKIEESVQGVHLFFLGEEGRSPTNRKGSKHPLLSW